MPEDSDNSSSDNIYHEHHLDVEKLPSRVESENHPVNNYIKNFKGISFIPSFQSSESKFNMVSVLSIESNVSDT